MKDTAPIGVMAVHGIGDQEKGQHLRSVSDPLVAYFRDVAGDVTISSATFSGDGPAHVWCSRESPKRDVLIAEAWWARIFPSPTFRQILNWSIVGLPVAFAVHVVSNGLRASGRVAGVGRWVAMLVLGIVAVPLVEAVLLLASVITLIPIKSVREAVVRFQRAIAESIGDAYVFAEPAVSRAVIEGVLENTFEWLRDVGCDRIVILAHSQGAALAHDFLVRLRRAGNDHDVELITYGSGQRKLESLAGLYEHPAYGDQLRRFVAFLAGFMAVWFAFGVASYWAAPVAENLANLVLLIVLYAVTMTALIVKISRDQEEWTPERVGKWADLYSVSDPVPNGPTKPVSDVAEAPSRMVTNEGGALRSHTGYWRNFTEFVPIVADLLTSPEVSLPVERSELSLRRAVLVQRLRVVSLGLWVCLFGIAFSVYSSRGELDYLPEQWGLSSGFVFGREFLRRMFTPVPELAVERKMSLGLTAFLLFVGCRFFLLYIHRRKAIHLVNPDRSDPTEVERLGTNRVHHLFLMSKAGLQTPRGLQLVIAVYALAVAGVLATALELWLVAPVVAAILFLAANRIWQYERWLPPAEVANPAHRGTWVFRVT